jgi:hypothetical protein
MSGVDPRLDELLAIIRDVIDPLGIDYAIGGALAMAAHGYVRNTRDVDLFVKEENRGTVLRALRAAGLSVSDVFRPHHFIALKPEHGDPDIRIDILVPAGEPDLSAIEWPDRLPIFKGGDPLNVVEPHLLAMMKFYSDRDDDEYDLKQMYTRGLFEPDAVRRMIESIDEDALVEWDALIAKFRKRRISRPKPTKKPPRPTRR